MSECIVCAIAAGLVKSNIIYETDNVIGFLDHSPINHGHVLLSPRTHYRSIIEVPEHILTEVILTARKLNLYFRRHFKCDGVSLMQNDGIFNDLGHFHLHVFPRNKDDGFAWLSKDDPDPTPEQLARISMEFVLFNSMDDNV